MSHNSNYTRELGEGIAEEIGLENTDSGPRVDYKGLNQNTGVVYVEYPREHETRLFAYIQGDEVKDPSELEQSDRDLLLDYFSSGDYLEPVDFGLKQSHEYELEQKSR